REDEGLPELEPVAIEGPGREDADDLMRFAVEDRTAVQDIGVGAEVGLPGGVTEDHDGGCSRPVLFRSEGAPEPRSGGEDPEVAGRDGLAAEAGRLAVTGQRS